MFNMDEKQKPSYYSILTAPVRYSKVLSDFEKILFSELTTLANAKGYATASNAYLGFVFNKSVRTIARSLETMKKHGFISIEITREGKEIVARKIFVIGEAEQKTLTALNNDIDKKDTDNFVESSTEDTDKNGIAKFGIAKNGVVNNTSIFNNTSNNNIKDKDIVDSEKTAPEIDNAPLNKNNEMIKEIIEYLNHVTNSKYRYKTAATQKLLNARINEGYTLADFKRVIDVKASQWLNSDMEKFLRPSTLFNATKFDNYANEKPIKPRTNDFKQNRQNDKPKQFEGLKNDVERLQPLLDYTEIADVKQFEMLLTEFKKRYPGGEGLSQELKDMKATSVFSKEERQFTMYVKTELMAGRGDWIVKAITGQLV